MKNELIMQRIISAQYRRIARGMVLAMCLTTIFSLAGITSAYADEPQSVYSKHQDLRHEGSMVGVKQNIRGLDFEAKKWTYCIVRLNGYYQKDITHRPSQKFCVMLNGKTIFDDKLKGEKVLEIALDGSEQRIEVTGYMQCVNAATHMAGKVTVDCFLETPGAFYVTQVHYQKEDAVRLSDEFISADEKIIYNDSNLPVTESVSLSWTESKTLTWQKTFSHTEQIGFSIGYKASSVGGFEAMLDFDAQFKTEYQNGSAEVTSKTLTHDSSVTVPPHTHHEIYIEKTKAAYVMPYYLEGYILNSDGTRTHQNRKDKCIFTYISFVTVKHKDLGSKQDPELIAVLKRDGAHEQNDK